MGGVFIFLSNPIWERLSQLTTAIFLQRLQPPTRFDCGQKDDEEDGSLAKHTQKTSNRSAKQHGGVVDLDADFYYFYLVALFEIGFETLHPVAV